MTDREQFLAERKDIVGGSDIGPLYNLDYWCRRELAYEKRGIQPDYPEINGGPKERGNYIQPVIVRLYADQTGREVYEAPFKLHALSPHAGVHVDGIVEAIVEDDRGAGVLECKSLGPHMMRKVKREGLQQSHILQLQHGMEVHDLAWGAFALLCLEPWEFLHFEQERDRAMGAAIIREIEDFFRQVENGPLPEKLDPKDKRCKVCPYRKHCQGDALIESAVSVQDAETRQFERDDELTPLVNHFTQTKDLVAEAEALAEDAKQELVAALGKREAVLCQGARIYYRSHQVTRWDTRALEGLLHQIPQLSHYRKTSSQRTLRIYQTGD